MKMKLIAKWIPYLFCATQYLQNIAANEFISHLVIAIQVRTSMGKPENQKTETQSMGMTELGRDI